MTDNQDWKFDLESLENREEDTEDSSSNTGIPSLQLIGVSSLLMPLSVLGVVAFLQESVITTSLSAMGFTGVAVEALVAAFSVLGLLAVLGLGLITGLTVVSLLVSLVKRSGSAFALFLVGFLYLGAAYTIATVFLSNLPLLVGYVIASTMLVYLVVIGSMFMVGTSMVIIMASQ